MSSKLKSIALAAVVAAAYAGLTAALSPISFAVLQFRLSEALCIIPFFVPCASWGLFIGCAAANLISGNIFDVLFGSLATLAAALLSSLSGRKGNGKVHCMTACLWPVICNGLMVGALITVSYNGINPLEHPGIFLMNCLQVAVGEAGVMFLAGYPLMRLLIRRKLLEGFSSRLFP